MDFGEDREDRIYQIQLPDPEDIDPHPRLLIDGEGIHAGQGFSALFPDGWHDITLEVSWKLTGPGSWYISNPEYRDVCPIGLFVRRYGYVEKGPQKRLGWS